MSEAGEATNRSATEPPAGPAFNKELIGQVIGAAGIFGALFYYFGQVRTHALYAYFGVDVEGLGLTSADYMFRSANALFRPVAAVLVLSLCALAIHLCLSGFVLPRMNPRHQLWLWSACVAISITLLLVGLLRLLGAPSRRSLAVLLMLTIAGLLGHLLLSGVSLRGRPTRAALALVIVGFGAAVCFAFGAYQLAAQPAVALDRWPWWAGGCLLFSYAFVVVRRGRADERSAVLAVWVLVLTVAALFVTVASWIPQVPELRAAECMAIGAVLGAYADRGLLHVKDVQASDGVFRRSWRTRTILAVGLAVLALFWSANILAVRQGRDVAKLFAYPGTLPTAVIYSRHDLALDGPGVVSRHTGARDSEYSWGYSGLRVLAHTSRVWLLLPIGWRQGGAGRAILLDDHDPNFRVEVSPVLIGAR